MSVDELIDLWTRRAKGYRDLGEEDRAEATEDCLEEFNELLRSDVRFMAVVQPMSGDPKVLLQVEFVTGSCGGGA